MKKNALSNFLGKAVGFLLFFGGFGMSGVYLIVTGFIESEYMSIVVGIFLASIGFGLTFSAYLSNIKWLNFILYIPVILIGFLSISTIIGFAIIPFLSNLDLKIDLGILILKDGFVRFALIILDLVLAYKLFKYLKGRIYDHKRIKSIEDEIKPKNKPSR